MDCLTNLAILDTNTGELKQYLTEKEHKILKGLYTSASTTRKKTSKGNKPSDDLFKMMISENFGSFYFSFYETIINIDSQYLFRYLFLSTHSNYEGYLEYGNSKNEGKLIKKKDLLEMLNVSQREGYYTINFLLDNGLLSIDDDKNIKVNTKIIKRGKINSNEYERKYARMFDKAIQELYMNCSAREHKIIGAMLKLLPYIHRGTNIVCHNPECENIEEIKPMNRKEIVKAMGLDDSSIKTLINYKIMGGNESAFLKTTNAFVKNFYTINPRITFKGLAKDCEGDKYYIEDFLPLFKVGRNK